MNEEAGEKYLLYIDILGFSKLVGEGRSKVEMIYGILNSLNVHLHGDFTTIVFSDTVLIYNKKDPVSESEHQYLIMYLIEFAEDLHHRLIGQDIYFRAILRRGEFIHYELEHLDAFFGHALIESYLSEKEIPSLGLFIDDECNKYNRFMKTRRFGKDLSFVFLCRNVVSMVKQYGKCLPLNNDVAYMLRVADELPYLAWDLKFLEDVYRNMRSQENPLVRLKYLTAWDFYDQEAREVLQYIIASDFSIDALCPTFDFSDKKKLLLQSIEHNSKISVNRI